MTGLERTKLLKRAALSYFLKKGYSCHFELGCMPWGRRICDMVGLNLKGDVVIVEVKQSIQDFKTDTKWESYLDHCNKFYFLLPYDIYEKYKDLIHTKIKSNKNAGLLVLTHSGYCRVFISAKQMKMLGANKRNIITRIAWRGGQSKRTNRRVRVYLD